MTSALGGIGFDRGLPANIEAEQFVLGSILLADAVFPQVAGTLDADDFVLEKHRKIFERMSDLHARSEKIDYVTLANELIKNNQLEACDGVAYLSALTEGLPRLENIESYVRIVKDKALLRKLIYTSQHIMGQCLEAGEEVDEILSKAEELVLKVGDSRIRGGLTSPRQIVERFPGGVNTFLDPSKRLRGLSTGFTKLDEMTTGLQPSELCVIAARPSMGKTALALNIAQHVAVKLGRPAAIFSLEMSAESLLSRMLCALARVDSHRFRGGFLNMEERRRLSGALNQLVRSPLYIDDSASTNLMEMHAKCRRLKSERGDLALVVIDYLQLMSGKGKFENRNQEISVISRGLKQLAKEIKAPVMALSQLSRAPEVRTGDHRPQLSDLRESGSIEQDADLVGFIFREEVYKPDREDLHGLAELIIAKQRNGPTGKIDLAFLHKYTKFENRAEDLGDAEPPPESVQ
ncbi:MAG TPA: replicative DNA helicase [Bryobacterales bacterium]|jgi:replicative DNA helicase|nr:replicative DNA helicase [Bryobacterales bacterium]